MTSEVGKYFIFDFHNNVLFWVLLLPYLTFLTLVPLTTTYLTNNFLFAKAFKLTSIIISVGIFTFSIADRFDKDYSDNIFVDAEINQQGQGILNGKLSPQSPPKLSGDVAKLILSLQLRYLLNKI